MGGYSTEDRQGEIGTTIEPRSCIISSFYLGFSDVGVREQSCIFGTIHIQPLPQAMFILIVPATLYDYVKDNTDAEELERKRSKTTIHGASLRSSHRWFANFIRNCPPRGKTRSQCRFPLLPGLYRRGARSHNLMNKYNQPVVLRKCTTCIKPQTISRRCSFDGYLLP